MQVKKVERSARTLDTVERERERGTTRGNLIYEKINVETQELYVNFCMRACEVT